MSTELDTRAAEVCALTADLVRCRSIAPQDDGAQASIAQRLTPLGFTVHTVQAEGGIGLWAEYGGTVKAEAPRVVLSGHSDVVPAGSCAEWLSDPFNATIRDGFLYGRGVADMKGNIAAYIVALEHYLRSSAEPLTIRPTVMISGDEECGSTTTKALLAYAAAQGYRVDYCLVAEPTSSRRLGDSIKIGRRGSFVATLQVIGSRGHTAYPQQAINPIVAAGQLAALLAHFDWADGDAHFGDTTVGVSRIEAASGADNVIPERCEVRFDVRFPARYHSFAALRERLGEILAQCTAQLPDMYREVKLDVVDAREVALPFLSPVGQLAETVRAMIQKECGLLPALSTEGGTSDARLIAPCATEVIEFGLPNSSIHKANECASIEDLARLSRIYEGMLHAL